MAEHVFAEAEMLRRGARVVSVFALIAAIGFAGSSESLWRTVRADVDTETTPTTSAALRGPTALSGDDTTMDYRATFDKADMERIADALADTPAKWTADDDADWKRLENVFRIGSQFDGVTLVAGDTIQLPDRITATES